MLARFPSLKERVNSLRGISASWDVTRGEPEAEPREEVKEYVKSKPAKAAKAAKAKKKPEPSNTWMQRLRALAPLVTIVVLLASGGMLLMLEDHVHYWQDQALVGRLEVQRLMHEFDLLQGNAKVSGSTKARLAELEGQVVAAQNLLAQREMQLEEARQQLASHQVRVAEKEHEADSMRETHQQLRREQSNTDRLLLQCGDMIKQWQTSHDEHKRFGEELKIKVQHHERREAELLGERELLHKQLRQHQGVQQQGIDAAGAVSDGAAVNPGQIKQAGSGANHEGASHHPPPDPAQIHAHQGT